MRSQPLDHPRPPHRQHPDRQLFAGIGIALIGTISLILAIQPAHAIGTPVDLGSASSYSVLGGESVTNTGTTTLNADLGVSPGTEISGFPPGLAGGTTHEADAHALQAQNDLTTAYNDAADQAPDEVIAGDIGGLTLQPGVYNGSSSIGLTGSLTLDAEGDPNAVFVFQIGSTLTTASSSSVILINGARSCNVFWQIGSSATLGTDTTFVGNILAWTSITANTRATVDGRALALNGSVTLDTNTFTGGACVSITPPTDTPTTTPPPTTPPATTSPPTLPPTTPTPTPTTSPTTPIEGSGPSPDGSSTPPVGEDDLPPSGFEPPTNEDLPLTGSDISIPLVAGAATALLLGAFLLISGYLKSRKMRSLDQH